MAAVVVEVAEVAIVVVEDAEVDSESPEVVADSNLVEVEEIVVVAV